MLCLWNYSKVQTTLNFKWNKICLLLVLWLFVSQYIRVWKNIAFLIFFFNFLFFHLIQWNSLVHEANLGLGPMERAYSIYPEMQSAANTSIDTRRQKRLQSTNPSKKCDKAILNQKCHAEGQYSMKWVKVQSVCTNFVSK